MQEGARKYVEHYFGVLSMRFVIIQNPSKQWDMATINNIFIGCVILHNLIISKMNLIVI
jgi:hypothetical protein